GLSSRASMCPPLTRGLCREPLPAGAGRPRLWPKILAAPAGRDRSGPMDETLKLLSKVLPTPMIANDYTEEQKIDLIEKKFTEIMRILGLDLSDDSLVDTPKRIAKMYVTELFSGLNPANFPKMTAVENKMGYDQMVVVQDIEVLSCCE